LPLLGVFAIEASIEGRAATWQGVANLGVRPTVEGNARPLLETHLFGFSENIYGAHLRVRFLHKLRDEQKFASLEALQTQIAEDARQARLFFKAATP
jgi:riboflavin kinase/FMN adenylyltransferase